MSISSSTLLVKNPAGKKNCFFKGFPLRFSVISSVNYFFVSIVLLVIRANSRNSWLIFLF